MRRSRVQRTAWWALVIVVVVGFVLSLALDRQYTSDDLVVIPFMGYALVGAVVAGRRPENSIGWIFLTIGMMLHAYYAGHPLPPMATNDEIFPAFIVRSLPHGIAGLVIAAIFAAAMSNLSGSLNSLASTTVLDFYKPIAGGRASDQHLLRLSRWLTASWGLVLIAIAILARGWGSVFTVGLTIASIVYGPMLGAFLLGVLTKSANQRGVVAGIGVSLLAMIGVRLFTPLAWTWYVMAGTAICMSVGLVVSRVSR